MSTLSLQESITKLKDDSTPFWELFIYKSSVGNAEPCGSYKFDEDIDKSTKALESTVNLFAKGEVVFHIKTKRKSNSGWEIEWDLSKDGKSNSGTSGLAGFQDSQNPLAGLFGPNIQVLLMKEQQIAQKEANINEQNLELRMAKFKLDNDRERFEENVKATKDELAELEKKYNSNTEYAKNGFSIAFKEVLDLLNKHAEKNGLGSVLKNKDENTPTPEEAKIEEIANMIFDSNLSLPQLEAVKKFTSNFIEKLKNKEETPNA